MARGKDAPAQTGGQIDPYVQRSLQQGKQQAQNRLLAAIQESGAARRTARTESGASMRAGMQMGAQATSERRRQAAQMEQDDKRAAEKEKGRREDQEFTKTMAEVNQKFRAKEAELDRAMDVALAEDARDDQKEIAERELSLDRFRALLGEKAQIRQTNLIVSMTKGMRNALEAEEKTKTVMLGDADRFDEDKGKYDAAKESLSKSIKFDKRMDLPARKPRPTFRGTTAGMTFALPEEKMENVADPMGVLQDLITKREGKISVEDLSSANIHKIEEQMINDEVQTEDINETFGALDAMLGAVDEKRGSIDRKSDEFDFWNTKHIEISQFRRNLTRLEDSDKKIKGSETETVGKRMIYALRTIRNGSLGNRVSRYRAARGDGNIDGFYEEASESIEPYEPFEITPDMNQYDIENYTWFNDKVMPLYLKSQQTEIEEPKPTVNWGAE